MTGVLCIFAVQPFTLREGHRMRALENRVLWSILGPKKEELKKG
jgi:hypothetical protein